MPAASDFLQHLKRALPVTVSYTGFVGAVGAALTPGALPAMHAAAEAIMIGWCALSLLSAAGISAYRVVTAKEHAHVVAAQRWIRR